MISGSTQVYALLGQPVRHSLSPLIHNHWFQKYNLDAVYVALEIDRLDLTALPLAGVNLTIPFKAQAVEQLDEASTMVQQLGAANTVVRRSGKLVGHNTDVYGFASAFETDLGAALAGRHVVVLGAGGAARAVAAACAERGAASICFANRTAERAQEAIGRLRPHYSGIPFTHIDLSASAFSEHASAAQLVVNCTAGPAAETVRTFDVATLPVDAIWVDINYWMREPPQIDACRRRGLTAQDGVSMLVHQAAQAFQEFTSVKPDVTDVHKLLRSPRRR